MRNFGLMLMLIGVLGFFYSASKASGLDPVPEGKSIGESLEYEAGRWDLGRYVCAGAALSGLLLAFMPKGE